MGQDAGLYETIRRRRDVRGQFTGGPIPPPVLERVLEASHAAPSVGLSQPWDFVLVDSVAIRTTFYEHVQGERAVFEATLDPERAALFKDIKVDGVLESTLSVVVTYDPARVSPLCSAAIPLTTPVSTRPASPSRTSGSRPPLRASGLVGCRSTGRRLSPGCWVFQTRSGRSPGSASVR